MRGVFAWIVALIASCAPDYGHTAFRCDAVHGCPAGQMCLAGRCRRGAPTGDGVVCGTATCDASHQCCVYPSDQRVCIAAGDVCPGTSALCDGSEDCQAGDRCCADGDTVFCDAACNRHACQQDDDCPSTAPSCCLDDTMPWGECSPFGC